ncbi:MAG: hypothetical protein ACI4IN_05635 [Eubacterium sp.]
MKKYVNIALSLVATIYTCWYMHYGIPYKNSGALSKIGLEHKGLFVLWGILTFAALAYSVSIAYKRYTNTKAYLPLLSVAGIGMGLTLSFDFDYDIKPDYYLHCAGSLVFSAIMGVTVFLLFLLCYKKGLVFKAFTYITGAILITDAILLLIYKETGLIEAVPVISGYIMLGVVNCIRERKNEPTLQIK